MNARPGVGVVAVTLGLLLTATSLLVIDWAPDASFSRVYDAVDDRPGAFDVLTQLYVLYFIVPLFLLVLLSSVCAALGPIVARIGVGVLAVLLGLSAVPIIVFLLTTDEAGTDSGKEKASTAAVLFGFAAIVAIALGVFAIVEKRGVVGRVLVGVLVVAVFIVHLVVLFDLFDGSRTMSSGAWLPLLGYFLVLVGMAIPYRPARVAAPVNQAWNPPFPPMS